MAYVLTNKTAQTPLGFGALGFAIEPGESATITDAQAALIQEHPVIAGWVAEGKLTVEPVEVPAPEVKEPELPPVPEAPEVTPPKVPTPTKR